MRKFPRPSPEISSTPNGASKFATAELVEQQSLHRDGMESEAELVTGATVEGLGDSTPGPQSVRPESHAPEAVYSAHKGKEMPLTSRRHGRKSPVWAHPMLHTASGAIVVGVDAIVVAAAVAVSPRPPQPQHTSRAVRPAGSARVRNVEPVLPMAIKPGPTWPVAVHHSSAT